MKTAKQKAIAEAYGEHWETVKEFIDKDGWIKDGQYKHNEPIDFELMEIEWDYYHDEFLDIIRPKSLSGIEHNNGWTSIENEDDLPKQDNNLWLLANDGSVILGQWCIFQKIFRTTYGNNFDVDGIVFTHYQPITKPEKPIY